MKFFLLAEIKAKLAVLSIITEKGNNTAK